MLARTRWSSAASSGVSRPTWWVGMDVGARFATSARCRGRSGGISQRWSRRHRHFVLVDRGFEVIVFLVFAGVAASGLAVERDDLPRNDLGEATLLPVDLAHAVDEPAGDVDEPADLEVLVGELGGLVPAEHVVPVGLRLAAP